jgi:hypothetical protein
METLIDKINEIAEQYKDYFAGTIESVPDWFIAEKLNTTVIQVYQPIICKDIKALLIIGGEYAIIKELSLNGTNPVKALCVNVLEALNGFDNFDMNNESYRNGYTSIANNLELSGIISFQTKQYLLSLINMISIVVNTQNVDARVVGIARGAHPG